jgi:hypothetical protein
MMAKPDEIVSIARVWNTDLVVDMVLWILPIAVVNGEYHHLSHVEIVSGIEISR